jgi:hypothetical protein
MVIIRERDIRYVFAVKVLQGRMPAYLRRGIGVPWRQFLRSPGRYRLIFENSEVAIFGVRPPATGSP